VPVRQHGPRYALTALAPDRRARDDQHPVRVGVSKAHRYRSCAVLVDQRCRSELARGGGLTLLRADRVVWGALAGHDVTVVDEVLAQQVSYYRNRAAEYEVTAYGDVAAARVRIDRVVAQLRPTGQVLEIACGTGIWTQALARWASAVWAIDAAPEMITIARNAIDSPNVTFEVADVYSWTTSVRFDVIFFSAWLSHVPASRFEQFWRRLRGLLADRGRVLFIDEHVDEHHKEVYAAGAAENVERRLRDGTEFRIVKNFVDPEQLSARLGQLGWRCRVDRDGRDWVIGEAQPAR
jgi:2-polyprenyl-3-methyl-5-hydroxy-6-metoxy-1,4-benzoquinol methylase